MPDCNLFMDIFVYIQTNACNGQTWYRTKVGPI